VPFSHMGDNIFTPRLAQSVTLGSPISEFNLLLTVWGIGEILGLTIMYEAGEMGRFTCRATSPRTALCGCQGACRVPYGPEAMTGRAAARPVPSHPIYIYCSGVVDVSSAAAGDCGG
jgi:hypothetical protein